MRNVLVPKDEVDVTGPTRTLLAVDDDDEVNSDDELLLDGSGGKLSSKSLPSFPSHSGELEKQFNTYYDRHQDLNSSRINDLKMTYKRGYTVCIFSKNVYSITSLVSRLDETSFRIL